nr:hypothetical protein 3 [Alphaproteobacteria bacterium]
MESPEVQIVDGRAIVSITVDLCVDLRRWRQLKQIQELRCAKDEDREPTDCSDLIPATDDILHLWESALRMQGADSNTADMLDDNWFANEAALSVYRSIFLDLHDLVLRQHRADCAKLQRAFEISN